MSDRGRVVLIFVIVGLLAGGGGYYFFKIYQPAQRLENARAEIAKWEDRYQNARECLLGKSPGSSKTSEALAIREMAPDPWDGGKCTPLVSKLSRGDAPDSGIPAVERAWGELDKASSKAAMAFARHVSESTTLKVDPLPDALDKLDEARDKLRAAAELPASPSAGEPLPAAEMIAVTDGDTNVDSLFHVDAIPSAHGRIAFGRTANRAVQVVFATGAAPKVGRVGPGSVRSVTDMTWGATQTPTDVRAGAFDVEGVIAAPTTLAISEPTIAAVTGALDDGVVVYGNRAELVIARAKGGAISAGPAMKIVVAQAGIDVDGRTAVVWGTNEKTQGQILKPGGTDEPTVELPHSLGELCLTTDRAWSQTFDTRVSFGGGRPVFKRDLVGQLLGCTPDAALFYDRARPDHVEICADDCRAMQIPSGAPRSSTITVVANKLVAITGHAGVLGVWREGAEPVFYALPIDADPVRVPVGPAMALTDGKVIDILAKTDGGVAVIRIPAM